MKNKFYWHQPDNPNEKCVVLTYFDPDGEEEGQKRGKTIEYFAFLLNSDTKMLVLKYHPRASWTIIWMFQF